MHYSKIHTCDTVNSFNGFSVTIWVSGCRNKCPHCFSKETWDFNFGHLYTEETETAIIDYLKPNHIKALSLLGGDTMEPENIPDLVNLTNRVRERYPPIKIYAWTGYIFEDLIKQSSSLELIKNIDYLIDGKYEHELRDLNLLLRSSSNQRVIDVQKSLKKNKIILYKREIGNKCKL